MPNRVNEQRLYELYQKLVDAQEKKGLPLTYAEMQEAMGFSKKSKSMASRYVPMMAERGYAEERQTGHGRTWIFQKGTGEEKYVQFKELAPKPAKKK